MNYGGIMQDKCVECFINQAIITREEDGDDCEFEVTKKAMEYNFPLLVARIFLI